MQRKDTKMQDIPRLFAWLCPCPYGLNKDVDMGSLVLTRVNKTGGCEAREKESIRCDSVLSEKKVELRKSTF